MTIRVLTVLLALTGLVASAANDEWPVATQATTQSCWRAVSDGSFSTAANWQHVEKVGNSWTWTGASGSVPVIASTDLVNGYLFNMANDYEVTVDQAATVNYLYVGQDKGKSESGTASLLVTHDLTFASPNAKWTGYRPQYGDVNSGLMRLGLDLNGPKARATVKDGAVLKIKPEYLPETPNKNNYGSSNLGYVRGGATLFVTNATLTLDTLRNATYSNQHQWFKVVGTSSATSTLHLVDATLNYTGGTEGSSYRQPFHFAEYARGIFTDTTLNMGALLDLQPANASTPAAEILINGDSVYKWQFNTYGALQNGGRIIFDENARFEGDNSKSSSYHVGPSLAGTSSLLEFRGHSSADFNKAVNGSELRIGNRAKETRAAFNWHSAGTMKFWSTIVVGDQYGEGRMSVTNGTIKMGGYSDIHLGRTDKSAVADQCVTGRLDIAGGVLDLNQSNQQTVRGLVVGGAYNLRSADATDYYSYGEVNITDGVVSNRSDVWVGTGLAKGVFRMTGGTFNTASPVILGAGGGDGEMYVLGGTFRDQDAWSKPGMSDGGGPVYIGGVSSARLTAISRSKDLPANFPHDRPGKGYLCVSNATFFVGTYGNNVCTDIGSCGTGLLELKNGAFYDTSHLAMTNGANSVLKFTLAGDTPPQLRARGNVWVGPQAKLVVDARGYTGEGKWIQLVKFNRDAYPNQYYEGWGTSRNGKPDDWHDLPSVCDRFDADCIETIGNVKIVQVTDSAAQGRSAGIWAHITRGMTVIFR